MRLALAFGIVFIITASALSRGDPRVFGIGLIVGGCSERPARDKAGAFMMLAFGIVFFVVTAEFAASERVECIGGAHWFCLRET